MLSIMLLEHHQQGTTQGVGPGDSSSGQVLPHVLADNEQHCDTKYCSCGCLCEVVAEFTLKHITPHLVLYSTSFIHVRNLILIQ